MQNIALPKKVDFKQGEKSNQGIITIEPCYPGYGMTLGNSLRRVLLSSLPGAAVVGVKIQGAGHEFTSLPHVKEDILEIVLNLKQLKLKIFEENLEEAIKLELDVCGKKEVKASDIAKDSRVEIVNSDLVIANITDMAGSLKMEIFVDKGRGYRPIESIEEKKNEIGYIEIDSIFSPVLAVSINVENVRVGKMTNWDKLNLNVTTDGTISPEEAFNAANRILIEQFSALVGGEKTEEKKEVKEEEREAAEENVEEVKGETKKKGKK